MLSPNHYPQMINTMKRVLFSALLLIFSFNTLYAQNASIARVLSDRDMVDYVWAIGYGATVEEADKDAINTIMSYASQIVKTEKSTMTESDESYEQDMAMLSNVYLEDLRREVLADDNKQKRVLRYTTREDWNSRSRVLRDKILDYIESGTYVPMIEDKIRYFSWAYTLLHTYYDESNPIEVDGRSARSYLYEEIRSALRDIKISVIAVERNDENRNYPYKMFLDFTYQGEPIGFLKFDYFDGSGYVYGESISDGRGVVLMKQLTDELSINIDFLQADLARQLDPSAYILLSNPTSTLTFEEAHKRVTVEDVKASKKVDTTSDKVASVVKELIQMNENQYVPVKGEVDNIKPLVKMMTDITESIEGKKAQEDIREYFTEESWGHYQRIVATGSPIIARTPEYKFTQHDSITICQSIPVKLRFSGNHSFIEDVVVRVNNNTMKVESVAYKLSQETEKTIMTMAWDDKARLMLVSFLEDYRTAYCLEDIDFIDKVFADDAYIIVGRVLKYRKPQPTDSAVVANFQHTEYSQKSKTQYIDDLRKCFRSKEFVNLRFEDCNVAKGYYGKEGIYAVQVRQLYSSNNYADEGILTLAIDMRDDKNPLVKVRVWQQEQDVNYNSEQMIEMTISVNNSIN